MLNELGVENMKARAEHTRSSGNVFADLELPDADERMLKAQLAVQVRRFIEEKGWTQTEAAEAVGLDQPKVSHLLRGHLTGFSVDRLLSILNRLGHSVEVRISAEEYDPDEAQTLVTVS
jgi:predicted XRE-type DNA-binding protein